MKEIKPLQLWETEGGYSAFITSVIVSENAALGVSFGRVFSNENIHIWDLDSGKIRGSLVGFHGASLTRCVGEIQRLPEGNKPIVDKYVSWEDFTQIQELINSKIADLNNELVDLRSKGESQDDFLSEFQDNVRQKYANQERLQEEEGEFFRKWGRAIERDVTSMREELNRLIKKVRESVAILLFLILGALVIEAYSQLIN